MPTSLRSVAGSKGLRSTCDRQVGVAKGLARSTINARTSKVVGAFKWAVGEELIPPTTLAGLKAVGGLKAGRSGARETEPVQCVPEVHVKVTLPHLPLVVADMVRIQEMTGMRSGELVRMCPGEVDRSESIWIYTPGRHKGTYRGRSRTIFLGPRAQMILRPYLLRPEVLPLFSPFESEVRRLGQGRARSLEQVQAVPDAPEGCNDVERALLRELERLLKSIGRVLARCDSARLQTRAFYAHANLLVGSLLSRRESFFNKMEEFHDRSGHA